MTGYVFRRSRRKNGKVVKARTWCGRFRLAGDAKPVEVALDVTDKQTAEQKLKRIIKEHQQEREGVIAPKQQREASLRALKDHLEDFVHDRDRVGRNWRYVCGIKTMIERLLKECAWKHLADITKRSFEQWRNQRGEMSPKTLNEYLNAVSGFMNWLVKSDCIESNPLRSVQRVETRNVEKRRKRRSLTPTELRRLTVVSEKRAAVYLMAAYTGLRREELQKLTWRDLRLDLNPPVVVVRASTTKNHLQASFRLHPDVVQSMRAITPDEIEPMARVFKGILPRIALYRKDLEAAGIPYLDAKGEYADFHALRKTYCSRMAVSGVSPQIAKALMRHSDIKLTTNIYTDEGMLDLGDAVLSLPSIFEDDTAIGTLDLVQKGPQQSASVSEVKRPTGSQAPDNQTVSPGLSSIVHFSHLDEMVRDAGFEPATLAV
jgi:integrase